MAKSTCTDRVVGAILSSWRYDISGITPEMRGDYEQHLAECEHCRSRQRLHRTIDVTLAALTSASVLVFLLALAVVHHVQPLHSWAMDLHIQKVSIQLTLQAAAIAGLVFSLVALILVAIMTPAPVYIGGVARAHARELQDHLPEELKDRLSNL